MLEGFDTNPIFVLSRPHEERQELFESLVQEDAIDKIVAWFAERGRTISRKEAWDLIPKVIGMTQLKWTFDDSSSPSQ